MHVDCSADLLVDLCVDLNVNLHVELVASPTKDLSSEDLYLSYEGCSCLFPRNATASCAKMLMMKLFLVTALLKGVAVYFLISVLDQMMYVMECFTSVTTGV